MTVFQPIIIAITLASCSYGQGNSMKSNATATEVSRRIKPEGSGRLGSGHNRNVRFLHMGPAAVIFAPGAQMKLGGVPVSGAEAEIGNNSAFAFEAGLFLRDSLAVSLTGGIPPRATVRGAGTVAALGVIGSSKYGPAAATAHYHFHHWTAVQPYLGGGISYTLLMSKKDGGLSGLALANGIGPVLQAGSDIRLSRYFGIFIDVKRIFVATTIHGTVPAFGNVAATGQLRLDPWLIHTGIAYRFGKAAR